MLCFNSLRSSLQYHLQKVHSAVFRWELHRLCNQQWPPCWKDECVMTGKCHTEDLQHDQENAGKKLMIPLKPHRQSLMTCRQPLTTTTTYMTLIPNNPLYENSQTIVKNNTWCSWIDCGLCARWTGTQQKQIGLGDAVFFSTEVTSDISSDCFCCSCRLFW